ncbi:type IV pilus assembly protein PilM [Leifsonia sp. F6_8S_P_1B]|uniref:Type IV pilus assembly protein PilM n=1 Tax=Leifsonia williamsii TaxID=3035919 RepID=A0ABT8KFL7_9MICO|nr:type IV pilus assembly protein PilM [Leifsonia williamsii]MDN4616241.1 type IV pilus assembly protein PilM [Leifsonia williamsii]
MASSIVGIDIGSTTIRAVELADPGKPRPTLLRHYEVPLPDGAASRGEVLEPNTVAAGLKRLWQQGGFSSKEVVLGMGNQRVLARDLTVPRMSRTRIRESLPFLVQDMLPVPVADALLDFYPVSEAQGDNGPVVNGLLVAAVKEAVLGNVKATQLAGLTTVEVDLLPFAVTRALITRAGIGGTVALVDIGANTTSVVIVTDGVPQFVRIIPAGGGELTQALRSGLEVEPGEAERIKAAIGLARQVSSPEAHQAVEIIYRVTGELLTSLRNTISYFVNTRPATPVAQLVVTGGGAQLPGLPEALSEMTRLPVAVGDPFHSVALSRHLNADVLRQQRSSLSAAVGLALGSAA